MSPTPAACARCGQPGPLDPDGNCPDCKPERPPERGAPELFDQPLPSQAKRLLVRLALFMAAGIAALFYELWARSQPPAP